MKNLKYLIGGLFVAGVGYGGYKYLQNRKGSGADPSAPDDMPNITDKPDAPIEEGTYTPPVQTGKSFKEKVQDLQKLLKVTADGVPGPVTMGKLNKYVVRSVLNASNIDDTIKKVDFLVGAVASLSSNRTRTNKEDKRKMWDYWVKKAPKYGVTFDKGVTNVYQNITGRSAYVDYKDVLGSNQPAFSPYDVGPVFGLGSITDLI